MRLWPSLYAFVLFLMVLPVSAHQTSTALLSMQDEGTDIRAMLHWQLYDLEQAIGLDADRNGALFWGEVRGATPDIYALVNKHLKVSRGGEPCLFSPGANLRFNSATGAEAAVIVPMDFQCSRRGEVQVFYDALFQLLPEHRLLWNARMDGHSVQGVQATPGIFNVDQFSGPGRTLKDYFIQGIVHIGMGFDHLAFLATLLLISVLVRDDRRWLVAVDTRSCVRTATLYVTTFTVAHSLTLIASSIGWLTLPGYWVELLIAVSVLLAALHNIRPFLPGGVFLIFLFGLVHGAGFASVLSELTGGDEQNIFWALLGFNLGVEAGQLAITLIVLPMLIALRHWRWYVPAFVQPLSGGIVVISLNWVLLRF